MARTSVRTARRRFLVAGSAGAAVAILRGQAFAAEFTFRAGNDLPAGHPAGVRGNQMWKAIEVESAGRIHVDFFPNNQLGGDPAMIAQLRVGALHFFHIAPAVFQTVVPAADITDVGFAFRDAEQALRAVDGPLGEQIRREIAAKGLFCLHTAWDSGMREITSSNHPIRTPDDMSGFKIRCAPSRINVDLFRSLGGSAAPVPFNETYTALQTKIVDGNDIPLASLEASGMYEVQKYLSLTNHTWSNLWGLVNPDAWKSLPPDLQALVERNNTKYGLLQRRDVRLLNASLADKLVRQGLTANRPDQGPFRARLGSYYQNWSKEFGPAAWSFLESAAGTKLG